MKIYFDDLTLAYKTLSNEVSRAEYDEYISQNQKMSSYWGMRDEEEETPEQAAERERRKKERGKKRFMEDYSYVNDEFFAAWQNRTFNFNQSFDGEGEQMDPEKELETMFDGRDLYAEVQVSFEESM